MYSEEHGYLPPPNLRNKQVPEWWWDLLQSICVADHLGNVWDAVQSVPPAEMSLAAKIVHSRKWGYE